VNLLLDTHAFLWFSTGDRRLSRGARRAMEREDAILHVSAASVWEMAIKASLGRLSLPSSLDAYVAEKVAAGYHFLPVTALHAAAVQHLPFHHRDPFDRLLAAQAREDGYPLVSRDPAFRKYGLETIW
jgi:PIN domain nuclease of toxin-antitoxin system